MEFWIALFSFCDILLIISMFLSKRACNNIAIFLLIITFFISAFRYQIGTDYDMYVQIFSRTNLNDIDELFGNYLEPGFLAIIGILKAGSFSAQMLFVTSSGIVLYLFYKGVEYYVKDEKVRLFVFVLYITCYTQGGFWWGMNGIRQAMALSVCLYASIYILKKQKIKAVLGIIGAMMLHYSAILFFIIFLIPKYRPFVKEGVIGTIAALSMVISGLAANFFMMFFNVFFSWYGKYDIKVLFTSIGDKTFTITTLILIFWYLFALLIDKNKEKTEQFCFIVNLSSLYIIIKTFTSFTLDGADIEIIVHRLDSYFLPFFLIFVANAVYELYSKYKQKYMCAIMAGILVVSFSICTLKLLYNNMNNSSMAAVVGTSGVNIDYSFNFELLEP